MKGGAMKSTAMTDKFAALNMKREDYALGAAVMEFFKSGGTVGRAHAIVDQASARMPGTGHIDSAEHGLPTTAQPRQPLEDAEGQETVATSADAHVPTASSSHRERDAVKMLPADQGHSLNAVPAREPTPQQRSIAARNANVVAVTIMETLKIDGQAIGDWSIARARVEGNKKTREGYILREAARVVANADPHARIRDVVKVAELQIIQQKAAEFADVI